MLFIQISGGIVPRPILYLFVCFLLAASAASAQPVVLGVETSTGTGTLVRGRPGSIVFTMDSDTIAVGVAQWPIEWSFSNSQIISSMNSDAVISWSSKAVAAFDIRDWNDQLGLNAMDPETTVTTVIGFGDGWTGAGEVWRLTFTPLDTGSVSIDSVSIGIPEPFMHVSRTSEGLLPYTWSEKTIYVVDCPVLLTGDANADGAITVADIILVVLTVFRCDFGCIIPCWAAGDTNCNGALTSADIIVLVNYVFKGGPPPCDVCPLIWDGTWMCP